jgi:hypothetical protein
LFLLALFLTLLFLFSLACSLQSFLIFLLVLLLCLLLLSLSLLLSAATRCYDECRNKSSNQNDCESVSHLPQYFFLAHQDFGESPLCELPLGLYVAARWRLHWKVATRAELAPYSSEGKGPVGDVNVVPAGMLPKLPA